MCKSRQTQGGVAHRALLPFIDGLRTLGHDAGALLRRSGLDLADREGRSPHASVMRFFERAVEETCDSNLGFHAALAARPASFDFHLYLARSSATLGEAFRSAIRFHRLIHDSTVVELLDDGRLRHSLACGAALPRQPAEFILASWVRIGRLLTGRHWTPAEVRFAHARPNGVSEHDAFFGGRVRFSAGENSVRIDSRVLAEQCVHADPALARILCDFGETLARQLPQPQTSVSDRVRRSLRSRITPAAGTARHLGLSLRSLQRALLAERVTYAEILREIRVERACALLAETNCGLTDVAQRLGYGDVAAFTRAFRSWTGLPPGQYRRECSVRAT